MLITELFTFQNEDPPVVRLCYTAMKHEEGDILKPRYCVLLASGSRKKDLPFVAKISAMWEDPNSGKSEKHVLPF